MKKNKKGTVVVSKATHIHPDHSKLLPKLNRVEGQISGVKKMIDERRYCPEIIQQLRATRKALLGIESTLLETHMRGCVTEALEIKNSSHLEVKLMEIIQLFKSADSQGIEF